MDLGEMDSIPFQQDKRKFPGSYSNSEIGRAHV
jgi:hypothetical protein